MNVMYTKFRLRMSENDGFHFSFEVMTVYFDITTAVVGGFQLYEQTACSIKISTTVYEK